MEIERAVPDDADEILNLQKRAYISEAELYDDFSISPLMQTPEEISSEFAGKTFLKITVDGKIVGSVRAYREGETCYIGRLIVSAELHNRGMGTILMREIERCS